MIFCESGFLVEDQENKGYSHLEIDFYMWIPVDFREIEQNHRLSLRKNLKTNNYELYKHYFQSKNDGIAFSSNDLQLALNEANELWNLYHSNWIIRRIIKDSISNETREVDIACEHKGKYLDKYHCHTIKRSKNKKE